ncbi:MAG: SMI1/KNR4 family protein [Betaproteobacteria bacterium]|nr:SMI1/KNR4 family protein [Betaproteobacteria bacterium]
MKKQLCFERKTASAILVGLLLGGISALGWAQDSGTVAGPVVAQTLDRDQIEETVGITLGLTKQPAGEIHVDYLYDSAEMSLPEISKPFRYELNGFARMKPGKRVKVEGQGILLAHDYLTEVVGRPTALAGFLTVWQGVMRDINRADPDSPSTDRILWQIPGPVDNGDIAAAEKRLGTRLPAFYRETMQRSGPWQVTLPSGFSFEMLAPSKLISVSDWLGQNAPDEGENLENQMAIQLFKQDIVFAITDDAVWVLRRSGGGCNDGQPSFAIGEANHAGFYLSEKGVCSADQQLEAFRQRMLEALSHALPPPEFAIVGDDQRLRFERVKPPEKKTLQLYLKVEH